MVSGDLRGLFVVLGVAGEGGEPDFPHHRGDGAISARDGAVFVYFRLDGNAGLGQSTTHTTLREPQNIFRQTVRRIHIRLATVHQHAAQATFQHQLHLLRDHCRIIHFKCGQQLVCELVRGTFLLICQLMDGVSGIRIVGAGGDKQTAW